MIVAAIVIADDSGFAQRTQFYDAVRAGHDAQAVEIGKAYRAAHPDDDTFALDLAYAEIRAGDTADAKALLQTLGASPNAQVAKAANAQLAAMSSRSRAYVADRGYAYGYAQNEARFGDNIFGGFARYDLSKPAAVMPYAVVRFNYDTRSGVPGIGQIYQEDAVVGSVGFRAPIGVYSYAYIDGGYSVGLRSQPNLWDSRYGIVGSRDYGTQDGPKPHFLWDYSVAEYSRFQGNVIGYLAASYDPILSGHLRAIAGGSYNFDAHRLYYNNYDEVYGGLLYRLSPTLALRAVEVGGTYLPRGIAIPSPRGYSTFRALLVFGAGLK